MFWRKRLHKINIAYNIVRKHYPKINTVLIEYNIVGETKAPLLPCFLSISKLKPGDVLFIGLYMNYQTFSNLQFRPLLKIVFHSILIDLKNASGGKKLFVSLGIIRFVLMFRKAKNFHLQPKTRYKIVASKQIEIPICRGIGRHRGRVFGALAQVFGRTAIPFLRESVVPSAKRLAAHLLDLLCQKFQMLLVMEKITRQLQKVWDYKLCENNWILVEGRRVQAEAFQQNLLSKPVGCQETSLQTFLLNHLE